MGNISESQFYESMRFYVHVHMMLQAMQKLSHPVQVLCQTINSTTVTHSRASAFSNKRRRLNSERLGSGEQPQPAACLQHRKNEGCISAPATGSSGPRHIRGRGFLPPARGGGRGRGTSRRKNRSGGSRQLLQLRMSRRRSVVSVRSDTSRLL